MSKNDFVTSKSPRGNHTVEIFRAAYDKVRLTPESAQQLNVRGDEFQARIISAIRELSPCPPGYADEEVCTYPKEYGGPKPIEFQVKALADIFDLNPASAPKYANDLPALSDDAEGWFAIPSVDALAARHFPEVTDPAEKYCYAVRLVHAKIADSRPFYNYREGEITPDRLRVHARAARALNLIAETQKSEILIVAAQLGMRHRGRSPRRARDVFAGNEFGLGSLAVGSIVLTHPERLVRLEELDMDCAGDEFAPDADGGFSGSPCFSFRGGRVWFGAGWVSSARGDCGSTSGFLSDGLMIA